MPLRPARRGRVGVIRAPVAKTAVVGKAVRPGPSPVAKTAVVGAAVTPRKAPASHLTALPISTSGGALTRKFRGLRSLRATPDGCW